MAKNIFTGINPLEFFPYEISEEIFGYLPVRDLLRASLVCSSWYKFIACNQKLMSSIKVKTSCTMDQEYAKEIIVALTYSERQYENLEVERCGQCVFPINGLLQSKQWRNVAVVRTSFSYPQETVEFFRCIEQSVEELTMNSVYVRFAYSDGKNKGLSFPRLRRFSAKNMQAFFFPEVFQNLMHLEHFEIFSNDQNVASLSTVMNFLMVNKNLRSLQISGSVFYQVMYEDISLRVPFKLRKLVVANGSYHQGSPFYEQIYKNLVNLIKQQADSLECISLDDWMGESVLAAVYQLPKLRELTIKGFTHLYELLEKLNLRTNGSIEKMHLSIIPDDQKILESIIEATPALRDLSITLMNPHFVDVISQHSKHLTRLSVGYLNLTHIESKDIFKSLTYLDVRDYRSCLRESVLGQEYEELGVFEQMLREIMTSY